MVTWQSLGCKVQHRDYIFNDIVITMYGARGVVDLSR